MCQLCVCSGRPIVFAIVPLATVLVALSGYVQVVQLLFAAARILSRVLHQSLLHIRSEAIVRRAALVRSDIRGLSSQHGAAGGLARYRYLQRHRCRVCQTGMVAQLCTTYLQLSDTWFASTFLSLHSNVKNTDTHLGKIL